MSLNLRTNYAKQVAEIRRKSLEIHDATSLLDDFFIFHNNTHICLTGEELGDDKPVSPSKSDTMRSTDSASGGETLEDRSSKEV